MKTSIKHLTIVALALASLAVGASSTLGGTISPTSQKRCVATSAMWYQTPTNATACAADFGVFDQAVHLGFASRYEPWSLDASQQSQIGVRSISATGMVALAFANSFVTGGSTNEFRVAFRFTQPVTYTLAGSIVWDGLYGPFPSESPLVRLTGPQGVIFDSGIALNDATPLDYATNGSLPAGQYVLEAYAGSASDFGGGETKTFSLDFQVTPTGPPVPGDPVYQLTGGLVGLYQSGGNVKTRVYTAEELVNLAIGAALRGRANNLSLGLVIDCAANTPGRLVVWDNNVANAVAEVGTLEYSVALGSGSSYTAVANLNLANAGNIVGAVNGVSSQAATLVKANTAPSSLACVNRIALTSSLGQMFLREGGGTNTVLIRTGTFVTGRKLGNLP